MSIKTKIAVRAVLTGAALSVASTGAYAGVVPLQAWTAGNNIVGANQTITSIAGAAFGSNNSWTDNAALNNSAWGHAVSWYTFQVTAANQIVTLTDTITSGSRAAAFTVWASNGTFNGGSPYYDETRNGTASGNAPHSFNAVGQLGSAGTMWASDPTIAKTDPSIDPLVTVGGGNLLKTLAYVNGGNAHTAAGNDWNEVIAAGVNQVDTSGTYFSSVWGSTSASIEKLVFQNLATGWYAVAIGGANSASPGNATHQFSVNSVSAVPVPGAVYLFGSALVGLVATSRRKRNLA